MTLHHIKGHLLYRSTYRKHFKPFQLRHHRWLSTRRHLCWITASTISPKASMQRTKATYAIQSTKQPINQLITRFTSFLATNNNMRTSQTLGPPKDSIRRIQVIILTGNCLARGGLLSGTWSPRQQMLTSASSSLQKILIVAKDSKRISLNHRPVSLLVS